MNNIAKNDIILQVQNLRMYYPLLKGIWHKKYADVKAVDGVSFSLRKGETLGLVGESGCGKTTVGKCIIRLLSPTDGVMDFRGVNLSNIDGEQLRHMRRNMQMVFQDPYSSLNPLMSVGNIISEPLKVQGMVTDKKGLRDQGAELLRLVQLEPIMIDRYPHELSGGQRQRVAIARALAIEPSLVVCDEAVSALDVSTQTQIIELLIDLQEKLSLTYIFISHDLAAVRHISDRIAVMYLGKLVELASSDDLCSNPLHPYTQALLSAVPIPDPFVERTRNRIILEGDVPSSINPPPGCRFHHRCWKFKKGICDINEPPITDAGNEHFVNCYDYH
ncbi:ABC transporter ATP-binding protein [Chloroflexota bacterium]